MIALRNNRKLRKTQLALELLDLRIAPAMMPMAAALAAEMRVETHQVQKWETALASAQPGSRHEITLARRIAGEERLIARQEVRLARIEARAAARVPHAVVVPASNFVNPAAGTIPAGDPALIVPPPSHVTGPPASPPTVPTVSMTGGNSGNVGSGSSSQTADTGSQSSLPANVDATLKNIYDAYTQDPSSFPGTNGPGTVVVQGSNVGIQVHDGNPADFNNLLTELQNDGLQVTTSSAQYGMIVGMLPIAQLPAVASLPQAPSITAEFNAIIH